MSGPEDRATGAATPASAAIEITHRTSSPARREAQWRGRAIQLAKLCGFAVALAVLDMMTRGLRGGS